MTKIKIIPAEKDVYLAFNTVFVGHHSEVRRRSAIKKLVESNEKLPEVARFLDKYNNQRAILYEQLQVLLNAQVFHSHSHAKFRFPDLPDLSPRKVDDTATLSLCLPRLTSHKLITQVQTILERACFDFARRKMATLLKKNGWDCAEAVELTTWMKELPRCGGKPFAEPTQQRDFYKSLKAIRHTAVHRLPVTASNLQAFLCDGERLTSFLGDAAAMNTLTAMRHVLRDLMNEMKGHTSMLEANLRGTLEQIAAERAALDRQEAAARAEMASSDREYQLHVSARLAERFAG